MKFFISAKSWQMFLVLMGSMFGAQLLMPLFSNPAIGLLIGTFSLMAVYMGWLISIVVTANRKLGDSLKRPTKWLFIGLTYAAAYLIGSLLVLPGSMESGRGILGFVLPLHLLAMAAIFYALLFTAKSLVMVERNQATKFFEYSGPFFLLWFFPIGVWFIQPKVNKLLGGSN